MLKFSTSPGTWPTKKKKSLLSPLNTHQSHTNHIVHNLFNACSNHTTFKTTGDKNPKTSNLQFIYSDTPVILKQSQSHQTCHENEDPKQSDKYAKFERSCFSGVREKAIVKEFFNQGNMSTISPEYARKSKIVVCSWSTWHNQ